MAPMVILCLRLLQYAIYIFYGHIDSKHVSLAWPIAMHPPTLVCLSSIWSSIPNYVTISQIDGSNGKVYQNVGCWISI
jgi:hypothetical protein